MARSSPRSGAHRSPLRIVVTPAMPTLGLSAALAIGGCGGRTELGIGAGGATGLAASSGISASSSSGGGCGGADVSTDPANCGACGHDCLGGDCLGGMCQPLVLFTGQLNSAHCLAIDDLRHPLK